MIRNAWYAVIQSKELKPGRPLGVIRMGERLAFFRDRDGQITCLFDKCAHRGAALSGGNLVGNEIQCPFHGLQFDNTGRCTIIPSRGRGAEVPENFRVRHYPAREEHGMIWIWWGNPRDTYPPIPFFDNLDPSFKFSTRAHHWNTHYSRAIENQLDVAHLPFVHHNTIGRGNRAVVDGPYTEASDSDIQSWVTNRVDDGRPSLLPEEVKKTPGGVRLHFKFPNVWQLDLGSAAKGVVFFAPVDDQNTVIYLRFYQKFTNLPGLDGPLSRIGMLFNGRILRQDQVVVETQIPQVSEYEMDENLFPGDLPIILYRKRRAELKEAADQDP